MAGTAMIVHSITEIQLSGWKLIIYRIETQMQPMYPQKDIRDLVDMFRASKAMTVPELVYAIGKLERVREIESTDHQGNGFNVAFMGIPDSP